MLRILIVDDHPMMRQGIRGILEAEDDMEVVDEAEDGNQALRAVKEHTPDLVLMDVEMPEMDGLEATRQIKAEFPETKVLALTIHDEQEYITGLLKAGVNGYVLKTSRGPSLVEAVRLASLGGVALDFEVAETILQDLPEMNHRLQNDLTTGKLSERQKQIVRWLADGLTSRSIAERMGLSDRTVKTYIAKVMEKLGVHTRAGAVGVALRTHIIKDEDWG